MAPSKKDPKASKEAASSSIDPEAAREIRLNSIAAAAFALFMLGIGLPLWWQTTKVYRVSLPYSEINGFSSTPIDFRVPIQLVYFPKYEEYSKNLISELIDKLSTKKFHSRLQFSFTYSLRSVSADELHAYQKSLNIDQFDEKIEKGDQLQIFLIPNTSPLFNSRTYFGRHLTAYWKISESLAFENFRDILFEGFLGFEEIRAVIQRALKEKKSDQDFLLERRKEKYLPVFHPFLNFDFYFLFPDPKNCRPKIPYKKLFENFLKPNLEKIFSVANFTLKSQNLFEVDLIFQAKPNPSGNSGFNVDAGQLPLLINPIEEKISTIVSKDPLYNFLIYFPTAEKQPLKIVSGPENRPVPLNSFVISSWGGFTISNTKCEAEAEAEKLAEAIWAQIRVLLGLRPEIPEGQKSSIPLAEFEIRRLQKIALVDFLLSSESILESLANLLGQIKNIVINDEVGAGIENSVRKIEAAFESLRVGDIPGALENAKFAFLESEKAFEDPSLLALLYFPEDQKYAIYIPLFLPVGLPVVLSLRPILNFFKKKREIHEHAD